MTLQTYGPERLDHLALRGLDLAAIFRELAQLSREHELSGVALHDKKPLEWLESLELWALEARAKMQTDLIRHRGARRAAVKERKK